MSNSARPIPLFSSPDSPVQPSSWREITIVLGGPLLIFTLVQVFTFFTTHSLRITDGQLGRLLTFEIVYGFLVAMYLRRRGWRLSTVSLPLAGRDVLRGLGVWALGYLMCIAGILLAVTMFPTQAISMANMRISGTLAIPMMVLASAINPIFEEGLWLGYIVNGPARDRPAFAYALSVGSRVLVHIYQGWHAVFVIAPLGAWFLRYYLRTRRLTPVLLAHGIYDLVGLALLTYFSGSD